MKKLGIAILFLTLSRITGFGNEPDMIVTQAGDVKKVYNVDISASDYIYYTILDQADAPIFKINKREVLIIKKNDGTTIQPQTVQFESNLESLKKNKENRSSVSSEKHVTTVEGTFGNDKEGNIIIECQDVNGSKLFLRLLSEDNKTLSVAKWQGKGKYDQEKYTIPDYIIIEGNKYKVTEIDDQAFKGSGWLDHSLKHIVFPGTLEKIGREAFMYRSGVQEIIIPENTKFIGERAFYECGSRAKIFNQIFIPKSVTTIGENAFQHAGLVKSPRGYVKGALTSIPSFINISNCHFYGIDEDGVEDYLNNYLRHTQ